MYENGVATLKQINSTLKNYFEENTALPPTIGSNCIKHPHRKPPYYINIVKRIADGAYAYVYRYGKFVVSNQEQKRAVVYKDSSKVVRVEEFIKSRLYLTLKDWEKAQQFKVMMFYIINYNRRLAFEEVNKKIFFFRDQTTEYGLVVRSYQLLKHGGRELFHFLDDKKTKLTIHAAVDIIIKILEKVGKIHKLRRVHHDLNLCNILINEALEITIIDGVYEEFYTNQLIYFTDYGATNKFNCFMDGRLDLFACGITFMGILAKVISNEVNGDVFAEFISFTNERGKLYNEFKKIKNNISRFDKLREMDKLLDKWIGYLKTKIPANSLALKALNIIVTTILHARAKPGNIDKYIQRLKNINKKNN